MDYSPKIIIIRGNSGSGKTTVAKRVQKELGRGTLLISQDVIRREMLWVKDGRETQASSLLMDLVQYGYKQCQYVILEGILNKDWYRELFQFIKEQYGANIYAYYYDLPFEETVKRHQTKPNRDEFGEEEMRRWWNDLNLIQYIEEKIITEEFNVDDTVDLIIKDVKESYSEKMESLEGECNVTR